MKLKIGWKLMGAVVAGVCLLSLQASALSIGDSRSLGVINPGSPASPADEASYINYLITLSPGDTAYGVLGQNYITRSSNVWSPLDSAVYATGVSGTFSGSTVTIDLGTSGYEYLLAKYDGQNYGDEVWYVGGLTGTITIPAGAGGTTGSQYGISGWALFTPNTSVPDGGSTALLLGAALSVCGLVRRKLS